MVHYNFLRMRFYYNHLVKAHHYVSLQSWAAVDGILAIIGVTCDSVTPRHYLASTSQSNFYPI